MLLSRCHVIFFDAMMPRRHDTRCFFACLRHFALPRYAYVSLLSPALIITPLTAFIIMMPPRFFAVAAALRCSALTAAYAIDAALPRRHFAARRLRRHATWLMPPCRFSLSVATTRLSPLFRQHVFAERHFRLRACRRYAPLPAPPAADVMPCAAGCHYAMPLMLMPAAAR